LPIVADLPGDASSYSWAVPAGDSADDWRLRVVAVDTAGRAGSDEMHGDFLAVNPAQQRSATFGYDVLSCSSMIRQVRCNSTLTTRP
jgi:hypothetical protein